MIEKKDGTLERVSCRVIASRLEICDEMIRYYNLEQDNELLIEITQLNYEAQIKISMLWGDEPEDMTTDRQGRGIICQDGFGWHAVRMREQKEDYWLISSRFSDGQEAVVKDSGIYLLFHNVIVYQEGVTQIALQYVKDGQEGPITLLPIHKTPPELRIECFEPELGTVDPCREDGAESNTTLFWCVIGADSCVLNPGNVTLPPVGKLDVNVEKARDFTLTASDGEKSVTKTTRIDLFREVCADIFSVQPHYYHIDCGKSVLQWNVAADIHKEMKILDGSGREYKLENPKKNGSFEIRCEDEQKNQGRERKGSEAQSLYMLEFTRIGETAPTQLIYEREPDHQKAILGFVIEYDDKSKVYEVRWQTYQAKSVSLLVRYIKTGERSFINAQSRAKLSSKANGNEKWKIESEQGFPVFFLLRAVNKFGKELEKQIVFRHL